MSKYRIVEKSFSNGWTGYFIEKRIFGFWCSYTVPTSEYSFVLPFKGDTYWCSKCHTEHYSDWEEPK